MHFAFHPLGRTVTNSAGPDEMQHDAASHQALHCLLFLKTTILMSNENAPLTKMAISF